MHRRTLLSAGVAIGGSAALGGSLWRAAAAVPSAVPLGVPAPPSSKAVSTQSKRRPSAVAQTYGTLRRPDPNGLRLPEGFVGRIVARSGRNVPGTSYRWHDAPDGGACFSAPRGWIYVSNSELPDGRGGASALRFDSDGGILDAQRILSGTNRNCAGGATPWGTWLSCEEVGDGWVFEAYPLGGDAKRRPAMGRFKHEAAAVDPLRRCVYLTEDQDDGNLYRFVPTRWPSLEVGRLDVLCAGRGTKGQVTWLSVPDPSGRTRATRAQVPTAKRFDGGEGAVYGAGFLWFTTKGDGRVWRLDTERDLLDLTYDDSLVAGAPLTGVDNVTRAGSGDLFVAEDRGSMEICMIGPSGLVSSFLRLSGHRDSEITGPAFSPDGKRLYFSSQRGTTGRDGGGITFEVRGPFRVRPGQ